MDYLFKRNQTMDPTLDRSLKTIYGSNINAGNAATQEDLGNLAKRTGENSSAYAPIVAEDRRKALRSANADLARADALDSTERSGRLMDIGKMRALGPDVLSRIYGSAAGAESADYGHAATASGNIYQKSPWMDLLQSAVSGGAEVGAKAVCWIAEVLYGPEDVRTHIVRAWLTLEYAKSRTGRLVVELYRAIGQRVAAIAKQSPLLRSALKPLFDAALRRGTAWLLTQPARGTL